MKLFFLSLLPLIMCFSQNASALDVELYVSNPCKGAKKQCFQMQVYLNGGLADTMVVSPGRPGRHKDGNAGFNTPVGTWTLNGPLKKGYISSKGDNMPYAMHFLRGFALHGSAGAVNGTKQSHGCVRLKTPNAARVAAWVREAKQTGGLRTITIRDTK